MKKLLLLITILLISSFSAFAQNQQDLMNTFPPSPEASSLGKYGELESSLFEGKASINVPIYNFSIQDYTLPISLDYLTSPIRVDQIATNVGLGWSLNAGGIVTQTVNGLNDLTKNRIIQKNPYSFDPDYNPTNTHQYDQAKDIIGGVIDSEVDKFTYNFPGKGGKFVFDSTSTTAYPIPYDAIQISENNNNYTIIDTDGTKYEYQQDMAVFYKDSCDWTGTGGGPITPVNKFPFSGISKLLTKITTTNGNVIHLEYEFYRHEYTTIIDKVHFGFTSNSGQCPSASDLDKICYRKNVASESRLKRIWSPQSDKEIFFIYNNTREDLVPYDTTEIKSLDKIVVLADSDTLKKFNMEYDYFRSPGYNSTDPLEEKALESRLKLIKVSEEGLPGWEFDYDTSIDMPRRDSYAVDHYGYYNGKTSNTSYLPYDAAFNPGGSDRDVNADKLPTGILEKITYPTGGYTELEYEVPSYTFTGNENISVDYNLHFSSNGSSGQLIQTFTIDTARYDVTITADMNTSDGTTTKSNNNHYIDISGPNGFAATIFDITELVTDLEVGSYTIIFSPVGQDPVGSLDLDWTEVKEVSVNETRNRPALLVTSIKSKSHSSAAGIIKSFEYENGYYPTNTDYIDDFRTEVPSIDYPQTGLACEFKVVTSSPVVPFGGVNTAIGHRKVIEKIGTNGKYGVNEYLFSNGTQSLSDSGIVDFSSLNPEYSWTGGKLLEKTTKEYVSSGTWKTKTKEIKAYQVNHDPFPVSNIYPEYSAKNEMFIYEIRLNLLREERMVGSLFTPALFEKDIVKNVSVWYHPKADTVRVYDASGNSYMESVTEFTYSDPLNIQLTQKKETNSDGDVRITSYEYAYTKYNSTNDMEDLHMLSQPYSVLIEDGTGPDLSKTWTEWTNDLPTSNASPWRPWKQWTWEGDGTGTDTSAPITPATESVKIAEVQDYDDYGNPIKVLDASGLITRAYYGKNLFGGSGNAPFSQSGMNSTNGVYLTGIRQGLNGVDPTSCSGDVLCTEASYDNLGRLKTMESPNGVSAEYVYDTFSRLSAIKNDAGQTVSEFEYTFTGTNFSSTNPNWIQTESYSGSETRTIRQFVDGLGRGLQTVALKGNNVIVSTTEYDDLGRHWKTWKPVSKTGTGLGFVSDYASRAGTTYGSYAYTETEYEASPLGRADKQIPMGGETTYGAVTTGYTVETVNGNEYAVTTVTDQEGNVTKTYTDGWGRTFRTIADPGGINAITEFVYNELDQLVEVRPPNYHNPPNGSSQNDWLISYDYDKRGNLVSKSSSDFGTVRYAYDKANRLRYSQDANQDIDEEVAYTTYDEAGRVLTTGISDYDGLFSDLDPDATADFESSEGYQKGAYAYDTKPSTGDYPWSKFASEISSFTTDNQEGQLVADMYRFGVNGVPTTQNLNAMGINEVESYYAADSIIVSNTDLYNGSDVVLKAGKAIVLKPGVTIENGAELNASIDPALIGTEGQGVNTVTSANNPWQLNLYSYDSEGRLSKKEIYTSEDTTWNTNIWYEYNRLGELIKRQLNFGGQTLYHHYSYNELGQLTALTLTLDGTVDTEVPEITYSYTADGQVEQKSYQGGTVVDYDYDIQSRLTDINDTGSSSDPFAAHYEYLKNGNIEVAEFRNPLTSLGSSHYRYKYTHTYDELNRLETATYSNFNGSWGTTNAFKVNNLNYDKNGNITSLRRYDESGSAIDHLSYNYTTSNRLNSLADATSATTETWDAEDATYTYDANGNLASQSRKFYSLTYNEFNLPVQINTTGGTNLKANYNSAGLRIFKEYSAGTWTFYLRDGDQTLATLDQNGKVDFNILGQGVEGRRGEVSLSGLYNTTNTVSSESESNNTQATADGPIRDGNVLSGGVYGQLDFQNYDWYYFEINGDGTVTYDLDTHPYYTPSASDTEYKLHIYGPDGQKVVDRYGERPLSGSFTAIPGRYYVQIYSYEYTSGEYYGLSLGGTLDSDQHQSRFYLKDHLGSTRAIVQDNGDHLASFDYYPFGLTMPGRSSNSANPNDDYKFTGHEQDQEAGINLMYAGARYLDPVIGRWLSIDPLAAKYPGLSPYNYVMNNPANAFDPDGRDVWFVHGTFSSPNTWENNGIRYDDRWASALNDRNAGRFDWTKRSYMNTAGSRISAGRSLANKIEAAYNANPEMLVQLVAHSHGGNVAIEAANILKKRGIKVDRLILLGTPSRSDFTLDERAVGELYNFYDEDDWVQIAGGFDFPMGNPFRYKASPAGRDRPDDEGAIDVEVVDENGNSHSLHTKQEIIDFIEKQLYDQKD